MISNRFRRRVSVDYPSDSLTSVFTTLWPKKRVCPSVKVVWKKKKGIANVLTANTTVGRSIELPRRVVLFRGNNRSPKNTRVYLCCGRTWPVIWLRSETDHRRAGPPDCKSNVVVSAVRLGALFDALSRSFPRSVVRISCATRPRATCNRGTPTTVVPTYRHTVLLLLPRHTGRSWTWYGRKTRGKCARTHVGEPPRPVRRGTSVPGPWRGYGHGETYRARG